MINGRKFAAFDIDGTLVRWQLYHALVDRLGKEGYLGTDGYEKLRQARKVWKNREHSESFKEYEAVLIDVYEKCIQDIPAKEFDRLTKEISRRYNDQVYRYTRDLAKKLKNEGYFLMAISGSHEELVAEVAKNYGFDGWIGTEYKRRNGKFTGESFIASLDKRAVLDEQIKKHNLVLKDSFAVGDSASDIPMLKMVDNPIAFNPDQQLFTKAKAHGWKIVVERKNVIYELDRKNDGYHLAQAN